MRRLFHRLLTLTLALNLALAPVTAAAGRMIEPGPNAGTSLLGVGDNFTLAALVEGGD